MNACSLFSFDLGACVNGAVFGWVAMVPWWGWAVAACIVVGAVYKFAGWPGVVGLAGAAGYIFGRRSAKPPSNPYPNENGDGEPDPVPPTRPHQRTIFDILQGK